MDDTQRNQAQALALAKVVFMTLPEGMSRAFGSFTLDPAIPLPVETSGGPESFAVADLSLERILAGMLKVLAFKGDDANLDYYRSFIRAVRPQLFSELAQTGVMQAKNGDFEVAYEIFLALAGLDPESPLPLVNLAQLFEQRADGERKRGNEENAEKLAVSAFSAYKRAMEMENADGEVFFHAGRFYLKEKEFQRAKELLSTAIELGLSEEMAQLAADVIRNLENQGQLDTLFKEAYDFIRMGKELEGIERVNAFLKAYPKVWNAWFLLGWANRRLGRWAEGRAAFETALGLVGKGPESVDALNELSICLLELGDYAEARKRLERALRLEPENLKIISNLGLLSMKTGMLDEARRFFLAALEIEPEDPVAAMYLKQLDEA
jgi:Flp pilus assembly protein TadD